jgi:hypothetical protein
MIRHNGTGGDGVLLRNGVKYFLMKLNRAVPYLRIMIENMKNLMIQQFLGGLHGIFQQYVF